MAHIDDAADADDPGRNADPDDADHPGRNADPDDELSERWKAAVGWADVVIGASPAAAEVITDLARQFTPEEAAELTLTIAVAQGFSKAAIAWGPEPRIPVTEIPTPGS